jgi:signal transduction histidine kinase
MEAHAPQGVLITDNELVVQGWNAWLEQHTRMPKSQVIGRPLLELFPDLRQRGLDSLYEDVLKGQVRLLSQRLHHYLIRMPALSEEGFDEMLQTAHIAPLIRKSNVVGTITIINDVTERAARERELRTAREAAEEANHAKDRFLAMLSHDLRVPLNAVVGWLRILKERPDDHTLQEKALRVIDQNTVMQIRIMEDLLDSAKMSSGKFELDFEVSDLAKVVEDACKALEPVGQSKRINILRSLPNEPMPARIDAKRMHQVVWNLLSNAVKFTPTGGTVSVQLTSQSGNYVLRVSDTGIGLGPDLLPHVFETMWQGKQSKDASGLGLGLSIVQNVVHLHGGSVRVESAGPGKGATFTVELPQERVTHSA